MKVQRRKQFNIVFSLITIISLIFQLSTTPTPLLGLLSLRQMLKVILDPDFSFGPQLFAPELNSRL